jgi:hypothetical protein
VGWATDLEDDMIKNEGPLDRGIRLAGAVVAVIAAFAAGAGSLLGVVLLVVAAILLGTAAVGFCPLYRLLGVSTYRVSSSSSLRSGAGSTR